MGEAVSGDVRRVAQHCLAMLRPVVDADWSVRAGDLDWDCRTTLEHMISAIDRYALYLSGPANERLPFALTPGPDYDVATLLRLLELRAASLDRVAQASPDDARGYHAFGRPDRTGYVAMGLVELLVHSDDLARGLALRWEPPAELCEQAVRRLFPWAPVGVPPWPLLQWATGRIDLAGQDHVPANWAWFASPLVEWDGRVKYREDYL